MSLLELVSAQTGLTPDELDEYCVRGYRLSKGSAALEDLVAVETLALMSQGPAVVQAIAKGGLARFIRAAKLSPREHRLGRADYERMYRRICAKAERA